MQTYTQQTAKGLSYIIVAVVFLLAGAFFGGKLFPHNVLVGEELTRCTEAGGEFLVIYNDFAEKYAIRCDIPGQNLFDYYAD